MKEIKITAELEGEKKTAEVYIYDFIGDDGFGGGVTAKGFADRLDELGPLDEITIRINSPGGDVFQANAIYNALVRSEAHKVTVVDGIAASAASYIFQAGDERRVAQNATVMIHCASGLCYGPADEMDKMSAVLRKMDVQIADTYSARTNRRPETFLKAMTAETWYSAEEAVAARLADSIIPNKKAMASNFAPEVWNRVSKRPDRIAALCEIAADDFHRAAPEEETDLELDDEEVEGPLNTSPVDVQARLAEYAARVKEVSSVQ